MWRTLRNIYRNTVFRLSLLGSVLFMISLFGSLGYIYYATIQTELQRVDKALVSEMGELDVLFQTAGPNALATEVFLRSTSREGLYLISMGQKTAGNLVNQRVDQEDGLPGFLFEGELTGFRKQEFSYGERTDENSDLGYRRARGLVGPLVADGEVVGRILAARDIEATMRSADKVVDAILTSASIALLLGILSSAYVATRFARRIGDLNKLATDVRAGHMDRRAPRNYSEDELDLLAEHLNGMLDHIDRLMQAMRYAGDSIAHDLRSPLTRLRTRLESAAVDLGEGQAAEALFDAADDAGELLTTFDSVLRIARLEAGERRELLVEIDPKPLLDDLAELYEPACEDAGLSFSYDITPDLMLRADRGLLSQAVSNLLENAIKYTASGGEIALTLSKNTHGRTEIAITDSGPGIPAGERSRVKERFVRLDKSRSLPGSGLGLSLVEAVAEMHGAKFELSDGTPSEQGSGLKAALVFPRLRRAGASKST